MFKKQCVFRKVESIPADQKAWSPRVPPPHQAECKAAGRNSRCWSAESLAAARAAPLPGQSDAFAPQSHPHAEGEENQLSCAMNEQERQGLSIDSTVPLTSLETPVWIRSLMNFITLQLASRWSRVVAAMAHWMMWMIILLLSNVTGLRWTNLK